MRQGRRAKVAVDDVAVRQRRVVADRYVGELEVLREKTCAYARLDDAQVVAEAGCRVLFGCDERVCDDERHGRLRLRYRDRDGFQFWYELDVEQVERL